MKPIGILVGLNGAAGAGKDTIAKHLETLVYQAQHEVSRYSLAAPLRRAASGLMYGDPYLSDDDYAIAKSQTHSLFKVNLRQMLITIGEASRNHADDVALFARIGTQRFDRSLSHTLRRFREVTHTPLVVQIVPDLGRPGELQHFREWEAADPESRVFIGREVLRQSHTYAGDSRKSLGLPTLDNNSDPAEPARELWAEVRAAYKRRRRRLGDV